MRVSIQLKAHHLLKLSKIVEEETTHDNEIITLRSCDDGFVAEGNNFKYYWGEKSNYEWEQVF